MRIHTDIGELELHWRRDLPTSTREEFWEYFRDSEWYKAWQRKHARDHKLPTIGRTKFLDNMCRCLKTPVLDQCADPIYALVRVNLPVLRALLAEAASAVERCICNQASCPCIDVGSRTNKAATSVDDYHAEVTCDRELFHGVTIPAGDPHACVPTFPSEACATGECRDCGVMRILPEVSPSPLLVSGPRLTRCRCPGLQDPQSCHQDGQGFRLREDAAPCSLRRPPSHAPLSHTCTSLFFDCSFADKEASYQKELHVLEMTRKNFMVMLRAAMARETLHRRNHHWEVHAMKLMRANLRLDIGNKTKVLGYTDFAARVALVNKTTSTCESAPMATCCVFISMHSPHTVTVRVAKEDPFIQRTEIKRKDGKVDIKVEGGNGLKEYEEKEIVVFVTDVWRAYSTDKGNAQLHHTLLRDINNFYTKGQLLHASKAWKDGAVLPIKDDGRPAMQPQLPELSEISIAHDGCACQYVCAKAIQGNARFQQDTRRPGPAGLEIGTVLRTWKLEPYTGSSPVDSMGKDANEGLRRHVAATGADIDTAGKWAEYMGGSSRLKSPPRGEDAHGDFAANHYYHLSYTEADLEKLTLDGSKQDGVKSWSETLGGTGSIAQGTPCPLRFHRQ
jgi:hypothetical protein